MVNRSDLVVIGISVGLALGLLSALLVFFALRWYKARARLRRCANEHNVADLPLRTARQSITPEFNTNARNAFQAAEFSQKASQKQSWWTHHGKHINLSESGLQRYSYKDIQKATHNFTTILGEGSFGPVYKAIMPNGGLTAVKVHASNSTQGDREFQTEVSLLGRLHHRNLVNLVGFCVDKGQRMLIYEFMSNGSLENLLHREETRVLNWEERLQIALGISHGIEYLHEGAVPPVIHRDLKSANILLDYSMRAKVADFGLSKEMVFDGRNSGLKGTYGYMDPAYISTNKFTMKSDIYSFGVIIFELITAIHPQQNLMEFVNLASMSPDGIDEILDQKLVGKCSIVEVRELAKVANMCVHKVPRKRPSMGDVTQAILKIKQQWHRQRQDTMTLNKEHLSHVLSRIENQHVELSILTSVK